MFRVLLVSIQSSGLADALGDDGTARSRQTNWAQRDQSNRTATAVTV